MLSRPRRNRKSSAIRSLVRETRLHTDNLIYPLFIVDSLGKKEEIPSLPGNYRWSKDTVLKEIESCLKLNLKSFILFPKVRSEHKDRLATYSYAESNYYLETCAKIKHEFPEITLISDVAMDPYNIDGHDGIVEAGLL